MSLGNILGRVVDQVNLFDHGKTFNNPHSQQQVQQNTNTLQNLLKRLK